MFDQVHLNLIKHMFYALWKNITNGYYFDTNPTAGGNAYMNKYTLYLEYQTMDEVFVNDNDVYMQALTAVAM